MKLWKSIIAVAAAMSLGIAARGQITPSATYKYAQKDTSALYLDFYTAAQGSVTTVDGKAKPTVIFIFGGGFVNGTRDEKGYKVWFKKLVENGYPVVSIDYRLGLKGKRVKGIRSVKAIDEAIHMGVEDLFSATDFLIRNASKLGIDPNNMVVSGSSAGAIISMQAEYELRNSFSERAAAAAMLPQGFNYAGVMSFAGAILSHHGKIRYEQEPCPTLMLHGTRDKVVNYKQIKIFNLGFIGSSKITRQFEKYNYSYNTLRYLDHGHDIANRMSETFPEQLRFLETNVIKGVKRNVDSVIDDPEVPVGKGAANRKELYGN